MSKKDLRGFWKPQAGDVTERLSEVRYVKKQIRAKRKKKAKQNVPRKLPLKTASS